MNQRIAKLRRLLKTTEADGILVTNVSNVSYLTGFQGDDSYLLVTKSDQILLSDTRFEEQLQTECPGLDTEIRGSGVTMLESIGTLLPKTKARRLCVESRSMSVGLLMNLNEALPDVAFLPTADLVEQLRMIKDRDEIELLRLAIRHAEKAFAVIRAALRGNQTERSVAFELEHQIRLFGGEGCSFPPIVAVGPRAALPHAIPGDRLISADPFVLIDWGACSRQYRSDLTRVLVTGKPPAKLARIYATVLQAQRAGIAAMRPGARLKDVDAAARRVIENAGFGKQFGHGLGHGIGLDIHESPRMAANEEGKLEPGMVITVEPGIYLPGWGGVRIEDDILVTKEGPEILTSVPKEFEECLIA